MSAVSTDDITRVLRGLLAEVANMPPSEAASLSETADLYDSGFSSLAAADLMVGLEEHFRIEFCERFLNRRTFASIASIVAAVAELQKTAN